MVVEGRGPVLVLVRGDHRLNEIKLQNALGAPFRPAEAEEVRDAFGAEPGFIGPVGARWTVLADEALRGLARPAWRARTSRTCTCAASSPAATSSPSWADVRRVEAGDTRPERRRRSASSRRSRSATSSSSARATRSRSARATSTRTGKEQLDLDGLLRHRARPASSRRRSSSSRDEQGISWPRAAGAVRRGAGRRSARRARRRATLADRLYDELRERGPRRALRRPRRRAPGEKFADAELLGCPLRVTIGKRERRGGRDRGAGAARPGEALAAARGRRRGGRGAVARASPDVRAGCVGPRPLRRPAARDARAASRCNPWTIPNAIGFVRHRAGPGVPRGRRSSSGDGRDTARVRRCSPSSRGATTSTAWPPAITGQYSRLGALLDPLTDRLLVLSGAIVAWHFELLPRWALAVLAAREAVHAGAHAGSRCGAGIDLERQRCSAAGRCGP